MYSRTIYAILIWVPLTSLQSSMLWTLELGSITKSAIVAKVHPMFDTTQLMHLNNPQWPCIVGTSQNSKEKCWQRYQWKLFTLHHIIRCYKERIKGPVYWEGDCNDPIMSTYHSMLSVYPSSMGFQYMYSSTHCSLWCAGILQDNNHGRV